MWIRSSIVALALFLNACTADTGGAPAGSESPAGTTPSDRSRPSVTRPSSAGQAHLISCADSVGDADIPDAGLVVVDNVVALPGTRALQTAAVVVEGVGSEGLFAKAGLLIRGGHSVELRISDSLAGRAWLGWGTPAMPSGHVRVEACDQPDEWFAFAGGYWVLAPGCLRVMVAVDGGPWRDFAVPVGAPCPG